MDNITESIATELRMLITERKATITDVGEAIGVSRASMNRYVHGDRDVPAPVFMRIMDHLEEDAGDFLNRAQARAAIPRAIMDKLEDGHAFHNPPPPGITLEPNRTYVAGLEYPVPTPRDTIEGPIDLHDRGLIAIRICDGCGGIELIKRGIL